MTIRVIAFRLTLLLWLPGQPLLSGASVRFELVGKLVDTDGHPLRGLSPVITLQAVHAQFSTSTRLGSNGEFKFKKLETGMYVLVVFVPRAGTLRRTVEVGPSLADASRRVYSTLAFDRKLTPPRPNIVSAQQLSISDDARAEYMKGVQLMGERKLDRARAAFERALEIAPNFSAAHNRLGDIAFQAAQFEQAEAHYRRALEHNPEMFTPRLNLGSALLAQHKYEESIRASLVAAKARPDDARLQAQLGFAYFHLSRLDEAERHLCKVKELDPGHFSFPQLILAEIYHGRGDLQRSAAELEDFLRLHPDTQEAVQVRKSLVALRAKQATKP